MSAELNQNGLPTRFTVFKNIGYGLIAVGLIIWMLLTSTPQLAGTGIVSAIWMLIGAGLILALLNKTVQVVQLYRVSSRHAMCLSCGWFGNGREWFRSECCPECDSTEIALQ